MSDVNEIILQELNIDEIKDHLRQHGLKYAGAVAALLAGGVGASKAHKMYKNYKLKKSALSHLNRNREIYAGAGTGALASLISSGGKSFGSRLGSATIGAGAGALTGSLLKNARENDAFTASKK